MIFFRSQSLILLDWRHHTLIRYYISSANAFNKRAGIWNIFKQNITHVRNTRTTLTLKFLLPPQFLLFFFPLNLIALFQELSVTARPRWPIILPNHSRLVLNGFFYNKPRKKLNTRARQIDAFEY